MTSEPIRTTCPYCGVGCGVLVTRNGDGYSVRGDPEHPANLGRLCSKGAALGETLALDDRLLHPEIGGRRASWDAALDTVAWHFRTVVEEHGPEAVAFYVSGQLLTEDYYVANKLMKGFIGSGNIDTNSRLCMSSAVAGHKRAFGSDSVPACYEDLEVADLVTLVGSNAAWAHPVVYQRIAAAKKARPAMKIVVIDPRRTATCDIADLHLAIAPGADAWLFHGLLNHLRRENGIDWAYLERHVEGFGAALAEVADLSIPGVAERCGLDEAQVAEFYRLFTATPKSVTLFSQGINQSSSGVDKANAVINVHLATGRIGKPGAAPFSITGQPNAMGGREVGGLANQLAAHMDFDAEAIDRVGRFWQAPGIARRPGLKAVELFEAVADGRIKALWIMATNPVVSVPEADRVAAALRACPFVVVSDNTRHTDTAALADVLLPAAAWGEKDGTVTNSERRISRQRAFLPLPGEARPDWWMVTEVARRMGHQAAFPYAGPAAIFDEHAALSAFENAGRRDFDLTGLVGCDYERLQPVQWPVGADGRGQARLFADGRYFSAGGLASMLAAPARGPANPADAGHPLVFNTGRIRDQWHTMSRTGKTARLLAHIAEPYVEMHPADLRRAGVRAGGLARVASAHGELLVRAVASADQREGSVFAPIHWNGQNSAQARVDALVGAVTDPVSGQPEFKHAPVAVTPYEAGWYGFVLARAQFDCATAGYWTRIRGKACWRYELAGPEADCPWPASLRGLFGPGRAWIEMRDKAANRYRMALLEDGRIEAVAFFDRDFAALPPRHWLEGLFERETLGDAERAALLLGRPSQAVPDCGRIVCACFAVGENDIRRAVAEGAGSVEALAAQLKAGTNCGSCVPELRRLLASA
ncbi:nitrate reductase [Parasulfuritortus cantonensis]|uniref:Nitrate reductase n=1 Tax=Parasulfuritortus cantonensis TaxID=2528202 RepID=A0A4R1B6I9_9PROT|nr:nitrate reductase [Parasulfuritortus cantonensis]TCJ11555.1 nitrate reductase [Parasulfuritortus cantonensis]